MMANRLWPVILGVAVAWPAALDAQRGRADVAEGNRLYGEQRFEEARERYLEALRKAPNSPLIHFNDANALYQTEEFQRAMEAYQRALESDDPALQANAWYNLGNAFYRQQQLEESLESYKEALRLNPGDADAKHNLETVLEMMQQQEQQQQQNQDQQDENEDDQEQDQQDQPQDDQQQDEEQQGEEEQDPEQQQPQEGESDTPREMSREEAERLLEAIDEDPSEIKRKVQPVSGVRVVKKW